MVTHSLFQPVFLKIRAYVVGKGEMVLLAQHLPMAVEVAGWWNDRGTIPCQPGDIFTFEKVSTTAKLKKGAVDYLVANDAANASGTTEALEVQQAPLVLD